MSATKPVTLAIPLHEIYESPHNTRRHYDEQKLTELSESIREIGQLSPVLVRPRDDGQGGRYEIAAGHRRRRAVERARLPSLVCIVREMGDAEFLQVLVSENLQREDLHPLDEAQGFRALMDLPGVDLGTVAARCGKAPSYIAQRLQLVKLCPEVEQAFLTDKIGLGHALILSRLAPTDQPAALAGARNYDDSMRSVAALRQWIEHNILNDLARAPFPIGDATLHPSAGSCLACPHRTGAQGELLVELTVRQPSGRKSKKGEATAEPDRCLGAVCWGQKAELHRARRFAELKAQNPDARRLTTDHHSKPAKDVLLAGEWWRAKKGDPGAVPAIVVAGYHDVGKTLWITTKRPKAASSSNAAATNDFVLQQRRDQLKRKREQERRMLIYRAVAAKMPPDLDESALRRVLGGYLREVTSDTWRAIAKALSVEPQKGKHGGQDFQTPLRQAFAQYSVEQLAVLLQTLPLISELVVYTHTVGSSPVLLAAAQAFGVDVAAIDAQLKVEAKKPAKKSAKAAVSKAAKSKSGNEKSRVKTPAKNKAKRLAGDVRRAKAATKVGFS